MCDFGLIQAIPSKSLPYTDLVVQISKEFILEVSRTDLIKAKSFKFTGSSSIDGFTHTLRGNWGDRVVNTHSSE